MTPKIKGKTSIKDEEETISLNSIIPEIEIAGIPNKNENLAAELRSKPINIADVIVIPDLDTPGISAST